jgi:hypothetical protein
MNLPELYTSKRVRAPEKFACKRRMSGPFNIFGRRNCLAELETNKGK